MPKKPYLKTVRDLIAKKLNIKTAQIYKKASILATQAQTSSENGIYLLAAQNRINLNGYLIKEKIEEVRRLLPQLKHEFPVKKDRPVQRGKVISKRYNINIGTDIIVSDTILSKKIINEATEMAKEVYPILYLFENTIRELISRIMQKSYGPDWWEKVSKPIKDDVQRKKNEEEQNPWHGKRGAHPIYYTHLKNLGQIIQQNWENFKEILPNQHWLSQKIEEVSHSRNPVSHMNPLSKHDIQRIKIYFKDLNNLISAKRTLIP